MASPFLDAMKLTKLKRASLRWRLHVICHIRRSCKLQIVRVSTVRVQSVIAMRCQPAIQTGKGVTLGRRPTLLGRSCQARAVREFARVPTNTRAREAGWGRTGSTRKPSSHQEVGNVRSEGSGVNSADWLHSEDCFLANRSFFCSSFGWKYWLQCPIDCES